VASCHLTDEVLGHVEVHLRAGDADVAQVRCQQRQLGVEIFACAIPGQEPQYGEGVPQVVQPRSFATPAVSDACRIERLPKCFVQARGAGALAAVGPGEEGVGRCPARYSLGELGAVLPQSSGELARDGDVPRFSKLAVAHDDDVGMQVRVGVPEAAQLVTTQAGEEERSQRGSLHQCSGRGAIRAGL
jgi:hypothetical protein